MRLGGGEPGLAAAPDGLLRGMSVPRRQASVEVMEINAAYTAPDVSWPDISCKP